MRTYLIKVEKPIILREDTIISKIYLLAGKKVMLDRDLAELYGVETRVLNQAVKRNLKRFPADFMFQLSEEDVVKWKSQIVISNSEKMGLRKAPFAFTEQGVAMLSSVLNSETAIEVNIQIIRIFTRMRSLLLTHKDILIKLEQLENKVMKQDKRIRKHDSDIHLVFEALKKLLQQPEIPREKIGFKKDNELSR